MSLIKFDKSLIKVSQPPFLNQSLKWQFPGSKFWYGIQLPRKYVDPNNGNSTPYPYKRWIGMSNEKKSCVGF